MNKILSILRRRPVVHELISRGAQMEAHVDNVCLGTNTQEDHLILLGEFFAVCQENHTRVKQEKCEFMQETMQYLGFDIGYGWWTAAAFKAKPLMDAKVRHEDSRKGLHDVSSFIGACNFYRRHIKNFTYILMHSVVSRLCFAFSLNLLHSPAVGKVGKPRWGHPLVE